jgi:hypothetical protein
VHEYFGCGPDSAALASYLPSLTIHSTANEAIVEFSAVVKKAGELKSTQHSDAASFKEVPVQQAITPEQLTVD